MSDDEYARPIPQGRRAPAPDDDVYVIDTRRRGRPGRGTAAPSRPRTEAPSAPAAVTPPLDASRYDEYGRPLPPTAPPPARPRSRDVRAPRRPRRSTGRTVALSLAVLLVAWVAFTVFTPWHAWSTTTRADTTPEGERPPPADGNTYLLVGSDSRDELTDEQREALGAGRATGARTDTIILVHVPSGGGKASLISIPRDSYLPIPGNGENKVNAAYSIGGPKLLVETVEQATGLPIDGYLEIGLSGFAGVVDSLGGVYLCVPRDMQDDKAHIDLKKGCQTLDGPTALGYVRARYSDPKGDIGRAERQRQFLAAVMKQAATPSTVLIPWRWWGFTHAAAENLVVGEDTTVLDAYRIATALRGVSSDDTLSYVVPLASTNTTTSAGSSVIWNQERAAELFTMLREGTPLDEAPAGTGGDPTG